MTDITTTTPMTDITIPTPTNPTAPPPSPMHAAAAADDDVSTQPPVWPVPNDGTDQVLEAVDLNDQIKHGLTKVLHDVSLRMERDMTTSFSAFTEVFRPESKACAKAARTGDEALLYLASDKIRAALELWLLGFKSYLTTKTQAKLALETISNPPPVSLPEVLPFNIVGRAVDLPSRRHDLFDVNSKLAPSSSNDSSSHTQGSVFAAAAVDITPTINQRKRKRRHASSPVDPKKARANPLWTDKEKKQLRERVFKYAIFVLANPQAMTMLQLAERISRRISKGKYLRSPTAVTKKMRNLGLVLTHPKNLALIAYLTTKNLMQYVPKRFKPAAASTASTSDSDSTMDKGVVASPVASTHDSNCYTEEEIANAESTEPTTTALAALIASIPVPMAITST